MKSTNLFGWLLLATIITVTTGITNMEFFEQIKDKGDIEDIDAIPDELDDTTFVLYGDADDDLDEDDLAAALGTSTALADVDDDAGRLAQSQKAWIRVKVRVDVRHHRSSSQTRGSRSRGSRGRRGGRSRGGRRGRGGGRRRSQIDQDMGNAANTHCVQKSLIMNLAQLKTVTHTFCLEVTPVGETGYYVNLVHDEDRVLDQHVYLEKEETEICQPYLTDPETKACVHFRLNGPELCTSLLADFWADHKIAINFGCMTPRNSLE